MPVTQQQAFINTKWYMCRAQSELALRIGEAAASDELLMQAIGWASRSTKSPSAAERGSRLDDGSSAMSLRS